MQKKENAKRPGKVSSRVSSRIRARKSQITSLRAAMKSVADLSDEEVASSATHYLRARVRNEAHDHVLGIYEEISATCGVNKAFIARRLGKDPAQVNRLLAAPGNWTLDTLADLLMAMGRIPIIESESINGVNKSNECPVNHERAVHASILGTGTQHYSSVVISGNLFGAIPVITNHHPVIATVTPGKRNLEVLQ